MTRRRPKGTRKSTAMFIVAESRTLAKWRYTFTIIALYSGNMGPFLDPEVS
jgi:hypothetical protein